MVKYRHIGWASEKEKLKRFTYTECFGPSEIAWIYNITVGGKANYHSLNIVHTFRRKTYLAKLNVIKKKKKKSEKKKDESHYFAMDLVCGFKEMAGS